MDNNIDEILEQDGEIFGEVLPEQYNDELLDEPDVFLPAVEKMRFILMACAILFSCGVYTGWGSINDAIFSFAFPALFIISGYLVLSDSPYIELRILNTIKRTAICFVILFVAYVALSFIIDRQLTMATLESKTFWIDFLLLNIWSLPIGNSIWFVQALLYAYIIVYLIYKLRLLRFDIYIAILCLAVTLVTGELAAVTGFHFLGHSYLGGNFITRALPYILIGSFIERKEDFFASLETWNYWFIAAIGVMLSVAECIILIMFRKNIYISHLLGMGVVAVGICLFTLFASEMEIESNILSSLTRYELMIPFFVCSPVYYCLYILFVSYPNIFSFVGNYIGVITTAICFLILYIYFILRSIILMIISAVSSLFTKKTD